MGKPLCNSFLSGVEECNNEAVYKVDYSYNGVRAKILCIDCCDKLNVPQEKLQPLW